MAQEVTVIQREVTGRDQLGNRHAIVVVDERGWITLPEKSSIPNETLERYAGSITRAQTELSDLQVGGRPLNSFGVEEREYREQQHE